MLVASATFRNVIFAMLCVLLSALPCLANATQLFMAGDSTMADKHPKDFPETGWGMPFSHFFSEDLKVVNLAKNGRSTRTFIEEGLWQQITDNLREGDFVIIQFGHNDEVEKKKDRYTTPQQFSKNLTDMISQVRGKGAQAILLTPVTRRYFDTAGQIKSTHPYSRFVREVAQQSNVLFIDMDSISRVYFKEQGDVLSSMRFMHIQPGLHPNYPHGVRDDTHFNQLGAREVAQLVLSELKKVHHPLVAFLREPDPKHLKLHY